MTIQQKIENQRRIIESTLTPLINSAYIFIDLPYYSNIGDTLIWKGTETFLSRLPYKCLGKASYQTFQFPKLSEDVIIIMMGGGNWGDLYVPHNQLRKDVVTRYPKNKIIILPQTVYYEGAHTARSDAMVFRRHKHLIICARDKYSYRFLQIFGFSKKILLLPDMAFFIDTATLKRMSKDLIGKDLLFQRIDKEKTDTSKVSAFLEGRLYDVSDWPLYEEKEERLLHLFDLIHKKLFVDADQYATSYYLPNRIREGVELISKYKRIFSNRLHGAILSILLDKEVYIIDNSYGKNQQYFDTWLKDTKGISYIPTKHAFSPKRKMRFLFYMILSVKDRLTSD